MAAVKRNSQESDVTFPNQPSDAVSSISVNGTISTATNMLIAGSWDNNVSDLVTASARMTSVPTDQRISPQILICI